MKLRYNKFLIGLATILVATFILGPAALASDTWEPFRPLIPFDDPWTSDFSNQKLERYHSIKIPFQGRSMEINLPQEIRDFSGPKWPKQTIHYSTSLKCLRIFAPPQEWRALHNNPYMYFIDILILGDEILALRRLKIGVASCWRYKDNIPMSITEETFEDLVEFYSFCDKM